MRKSIILIFILVTLTSFGQEKLTLDKCYLLINKNYPLAKQNELLVKQNTLDLEVLKTGQLPQLDFSAQATYQADVTQMPVSIPNSTIKPPNKDQYKATFSVNQLIYNGGLIEVSSASKLANLKSQLKQVEINLFQQKKRVNQYYFSILLQQEKKQVLIAKKRLLNSKLKEVKSGIKHGVLVPTSDKILEAELIKTEQYLVELELNKTNLLKSLSLLIGEPISNNTLIEIPEFLTTLTTEIKRPELEFFQLQKDFLNTKEQLLHKQNSPRILGFATGGYGNPGLNMLDNSFQPFYHFGIKLNWKLFDWNANKKQRESLQINKDIINTETNQFKLNTSVELELQASEIEKLTLLIESDKSIIELRKEILKSAESQLKNGIISSSAYLTELTNLFIDENNLQTHKIELLLAKANYNLTLGN